MLTQKEFNEFYFLFLGNCDLYDSKIFMQFDDFNAQNMFTETLLLINKKLSIPEMIHEFKTIASKYAFQYNLLIPIRFEIDQNNQLTYTYQGK